MATVQVCVSSPYLQQPFLGLSAVSQRSCVVRAVCNEMSLKEEHFLIAEVCCCFSFSPQSLLSLNKSEMCQSWTEKLSAEGRQDNYYICRSGLQYFSIPSKVSAQLSLLGS